MTDQSPPAWADKLAAKLDALFPHEDDTPPWAQKILDRLDGAPSGKSTDEPEWVTTLMGKLDALGGAKTDPGKGTPKAPQRKTTAKEGSADPPAGEKHSKPSRWFS